MKLLKGLRRVLRHFLGKSRKNRQEDGGNFILQEEEASAISQKSPAGEKNPVWIVDFDNQEETNELDTTPISIPEEFKDDNPGWVADLDVVEYLTIPETSDVPTVYYKRRTTVDWWNEFFNSDKRVELSFKTRGDSCGCLHPADPEGFAITSVEYYKHVHPEMRHNSCPDIFYALKEGLKHLVVPPLTPKE